MVAQHRNQCYGRSKTRIFDRFSSSPPSRGFKGRNCRSFESGARILTSPFPFHDSPEPKSPCEQPKSSKRSSPIAISPKTITKEPSFYNVEEFCYYSELWAGPAYTNSPPPSSLPIPKFSLRQKRSVSLELPLPLPEIVLLPLARSSPSSPASDKFSSATENLRRILQLDVADD